MKICSGLKELVEDCRGYPLCIPQTEKHDICNRKISSCQLESMSFGDFLKSLYSVSIYHQWTRYDSEAGIILACPKSHSVR